VLTMYGFELIAACAVALATRLRASAIRSAIDSLEIPFSLDIAATGLGGKLAGGAADVAGIPAFPSFAAIAAFARAITSSIAACWSSELIVEVKQH
jgi:hypothetical protein